MTPGQAQAVYQSYLRISDDAAAAGAMAAGLGAVSNAAWAALHAQYIEMGATGVPVQRYVYGTPAFYVPRLDSYPHWFMVAVPRRPAGGSASATALMVFSQLSASGTWTLSGVADLATGQPVPDIAQDSTGYVTALPADQHDVLVRPEIAGATQAAVVDEGPAAPASAVVADGPQTTGLYREQEATAKAAVGQRLEYSWLMTGAPFPVYALRTADGGALVLYGMSLSTTTAHPNRVEGQAIPVPADLQRLMPAGQIASHAYYVTSTYEFAAIDPPATAHGGKLVIIAASGSPTSAHAYLLTS